MGCLHAKSPGSINHTLDVLITQSHGLKDAAAVELANWMQIVCTQHGLSSFYQKGLSGSVKLEGTRRRLLRDRFESARCVAAAAVQSANKFGLNAPLANEILWAEQHHKPVLLVYDSSKTFDLHLWESSWPPLFQPQPMVTRYFGKGHEACVESFIAQVHHVLSGAQEMPMPSSQQKMAEEFESAAVAEKCIVTDEAWEAALHQLRLAQPQDLPKGRFVKGILKKSEQKPKQRPGPDHVFFEETLQEAIRFIVKSLPQVGDEAFLDLLCASVGVSERLVAASLRHLAAIPSLQMHELIEEVQMWSLIALRRHGDSVDVCTFALECLDVLAAKNPRYVSSAEAESLVSAIGNFPSCHALQRHGFSFLAQLLANQQASPKSAKLQDASFALPGGGLARIITRLGVADLALSALVLHQDEVLFHDVCFLLQLLAPSSREVKMLILQKGEKLWLRALAQKSGLPSGPVLAMFSALVADDYESKVTAGAIPGLLEALLDNLESDPLQVLAFLCCLTSQCLQNKRLCTAFGESFFVRQAVQYCSSEMPLELRLAAGGFLVNLCSDTVSLSTVSSLGVKEAAVALSASSSDELKRCGEALRQLMEQPSIASISSLASDGRRWKTDGSGADSENPFSGLFAIRRQLQAPEAPRFKQDLKEIEDPKNIEDPRSKRPERSEREMRGPGWQRMPGHALKERKLHNEEVTAGEEIETGFELGEWASSELARPLSGFKGLSKDLWIKKDDLQKMPEDDEDPEEVFAPETSRSLQSSKALDVQPVEKKPLPSTQVSKGLTLRPRLEELRDKALAGERAAPKGRFFSWLGGSAKRSTGSKDLRERDQPSHEMWIARRAQVEEEGEVQLDFDFRSPSQQSMGQVRSKKSVATAVSFRDSQGAQVARKVTTQGSASQILHFTSQDFH